MMGNDSVMNTFQISTGPCYVDLEWKDDEFPLKRVSFSNVKRKNTCESENTKVLIIADEIFRYFKGFQVRFSLNYLDISDQSDFARHVLENLLSVDYGNTVSYKELAIRSGTSAVRAVGSVMARNRFPIIYPCHRVIRSDFSTGHYTGGRNLKQYLINLERGNLG